MLCVLTADGKERRLDPATIHDAPVEDDPKIFNDTRRVQAPLPGIAVGAVAEVVIDSVQTRALHNAGISWRYHVGLVGYRSERVRVIVETPADLPLRWKSFPHVSGDPAADGEPALWIDATSEFSPVGEVPSAVQGRLALVAAPGVESLTRIPPATSEENRMVRRREIFFDPDLEEIRLVETSEGSGSYGRALRAAFQQLDEAARQEALEGYVENTHDCEELLSWEVGEPRDTDAPFHFRVEAKDFGNAYIDLDGAALWIQSGPLLQGLPEVFFEEEEDEDEDTEDEPIEGSGADEEIGASGEESGDEAPASAGRSSDLLLEEPFVSEYRYRVSAPDGYRPVDLEDDEERELGATLLTRRTTVDDDGAVHVTLRFDTVRSRFTPAEVAATRDAILDYFEEDAVVVRFEQTAQAHLAVGEVKEALGEIDRLIAAAPERALPHVRRSRALLEAGLGAAARDEARKAIELEPENVIAHQSLGWILQHDLFGRHLRPGWDVEGSRAAYRRILELEPDDTLAHQSLAIVLEHDGDGLRYRDAEALDEAIAEYRVLRELEEEAALDENLLIALFKAERYDEAVELAREIPESETTRVILLAALAAGEGRDAAFAELESISGGDERRAGLAVAAQSLIQQRLYPQAVDLLSRAAKGTEGANDVHTQIELLSRTRRHEELVLDTPEGIARQILLALQLGVNEEFLELFSEQLRLAIPDEEIEDLGAASSLLRETLREGGVPLEVIADISQATAQVTLDGDAFFHFWRCGRRGDAGQMRWAAVALLSQSALAERVVDDLDQALAEAPEGAERRRLELARARAAVELERYAEAAAFAAAWLEEEPTSDAAFDLLSAALVELEDFDRLTAASNARLEVLKDDPVGLRGLITVAQARGDLAEIDRLLGRLVELGAALSVDYNNLAWNDVVLGEVGEDTVSMIRRGAEQMSAVDDLSGLGLFRTLYGTFATVYAEIGQSAEAREMLFNAMLFGGDAVLRSEDWLVLGRIAENYGVLDVARDAYTRVEPGEEGFLEQISSHHLARRSLERLEKISAQEQ